MIVSEVLFDQRLEIGRHAIGLSQHVRGSIFRNGNEPFKHHVSFFELLKHETCQINSRRDTASLDEKWNLERSVVKTKAADTRNHMLIAKLCSVNRNREEHAVAHVFFTQLFVSFDVFERLSLAGSEVGENPFGYFLVFWHYKNNCVLQEVNKLVVLVLGQT